MLDVLDIKQESSPGVSRFGAWQHFSLHRFFYVELLGNWSSIYLLWTVTTSLVTAIVCPGRSWSLGLGPSTGTPCETAGGARTRARGNNNGEWEVGWHGWKLVGPPISFQSKMVGSIVPIKLNDWHTCVTLLPSFGTRTPVLQCKMILRWTRFSNISDILWLGFGSHLWVWVRRCKALWIDSLYFDLISYHHHIRRYYVQKSSHQAASCSHVSTSPLTFSSNALVPWLCKWYVVTWLP